MESNHHSSPPDQAPSHSRMVPRLENDYAIAQTIGHSVASQQSLDDLRNAYRQRWQISSQVISMLSTQYHQLQQSLGRLKNDIVSRKTHQFYIVQSTSNNITEKLTELREQSTALVSSTNAMYQNMLNLVEQQRTAAESVLHTQQLLPPILAQIKEEETVLFHEYQQLLTLKANIDCSSAQVTVLSQQAKQRQQDVSDDTSTAKNLQRDVESYHSRLHEVLARQTTSQQQLLTSAQHLSKHQQQYTQFIEQLSKTDSFHAAAHLLSFFHDNRDIDHIDGNLTKLITTISQKTLTPEKKDNMENTAVSDDLFGISFGSEPIFTRTDIEGIAVNLNTIRTLYTTRQKELCEQHANLTTQLITLEQFNVDKNEELQQINSNIQKLTEKQRILHDNIAELSSLSIIAALAHDLRAESQQIQIEMADLTTQLEQSNFALKTAHDAFDQTTEHHHAFLANAGRLQQLTNDLKNTKESEQISAQILEIENMIQLYTVPPQTELKGDEDPADLESIQGSTICSQSKRAGKSRGKKAPAKSKSRHKKTTIVEANDNYDDLMKNTTIPQQNPQKQLQLLKTQLQQLSTRFDSLKQEIIAEQDQFDQLQTDIGENRSKIETNRALIDENTSRLEIETLQAQLNAANDGEENTNKTFNKAFNSIKHDKKKMAKVVKMETRRAKLNDILEKIDTMKSKYQNMDGASV